MNLYFLNQVQTNSHIGNELTNHIPPYYILNGGTTVLNLNTIIGNGSYSETLWQTIPNQAIIRNSQQ